MVKLVTNATRKADVAGGIDFIQCGRQVFLTAGVLNPNGLSNFSLYRKKLNVMITPRYTHITIDKAC